MPAGQLLDSIGGHVNPLQLVQQIPAGMRIPALRDRLVRIIAEFRTQTSLSEGCNTILRHDCVVLAQVPGLCGFQRPALRGASLGMPSV